MSTPKGRFKDQIRVRSTRMGTQYVRFSDVLMSQNAKREIRLAEETFGKQETSTPTTQSRKSGSRESD